MCGAGRFVEYGVVPAFGNAFVSRSEAEDWSVFINEGRQRAYPNVACDRITKLR
jgi:hypothetical protein